MKWLFFFLSFTCFSLQAEDQLPNKPQEEILPEQFVAPYIHPGVIVQKDNVWRGYDNMLHLGNSLSLSVSVIAPQGMTLPISESSIYNKVANLFIEAGLIVQRAKGLEKPTLPMFNLMVLIYPITDGYSAFIEGRLMEAVDLNRLSLSNTALYQAITWEQKNLIVSNAKQFNDLFLQTVDQIGKSFTDRYTFFAAHEEQPEETPKIREREFSPPESHAKKIPKKPIVPFQNNPPQDTLKMR